MVGTITKCEYCDDYATVANKIVERDADDMENTRDNQTVLDVIYTCVTHKPEAFEEMKLVCKNNYRRDIMKVEHKKW